MQDLQHYDLICLDCKVPINELDLRMYENLSKRLSPGGPKSMCFAAKGRLQGRAAKLLRARRKSRYSEHLRFALQLTARRFNELPSVSGLA